MVLLPETREVLKGKNQASQKPVSASSSASVKTGTESCLVSKLSGFHIKNYGLPVNCLKYKERKHKLHLKCKHQVLMNYWMPEYTLVI